MKKTIRKAVNGFKRETIAKFIKTAKSALKHYRERIENGDALKVCITSGNVKIGRVMNVSLLPIVTCANCRECKRLCYDIKACLQYVCVLMARARNTALAMYNRDEYFRQIAAKLSRRKTRKFFRWHVGGDIPDYDYFERMIAVAEAFPDFRFWTYTKNYGIVNLYCARHGGSKDCVPSNLVVMFSKWDGMKMLNPYGFPEFYCKLPDGNKDTTEEEFSKMHKCPGNCEICLATGRGCPFAETSVANAH